jgi:methionine-rich copper-binding protein CopC
MAIHGGIRGFVIAGLLSLAGVMAAYAHAHLDRASPAAGATVATAPSEVTLHFTEKLEPKFSAIVVRDAAGKQVDKGDTGVDAADQALLRVSLQPLVPGRYKVEWRVTSVDTHSSKGDYSFRVGK